MCFIIYCYNNQAYVVENITTMLFFHLVMTMLTVLYLSSADIYNIIKIKIQQVRTQAKLKIHVSFCFTYFTTNLKKQATIAAPRALVLTRNPPPPQTKQTLFIPLPTTNIQCLKQH